MPTISVWPPISSKSTCSSSRGCESGLESVQDVFRTQEIVQRFTEQNETDKKRVGFITGTSENLKTSNKKIET